MIKDYTITLPVLTEVLGPKGVIHSVEQIGDVVFWKGLTAQQAPIKGGIDTHKLQYLCKKWAVENNYIINSSPFVETKNVRMAAIAKVWEGIEHREPLSAYKANTEPEAVFKACEYILGRLKQRGIL